MFPVVWVFFSLEHSILCIGNGGDFFFASWKLKNIKIKAAVMITILPFSLIYPYILVC